MWCACRGSAKTHHTTDEAALKQLAPLHPLPALVLEYRRMQNILNKWVEPDWVKQTAAAHAGASPTHAQREHTHTHSRTKSNSMTHGMPCQATGSSLPGGRELVLQEQDRALQRHACMTQAAVASAQVAKQVAAHSLMKTQYDDLHVELSA